MNAFLVLLILAAQTSQATGPSVEQRTTGNCSPAVSEVNGNVQLTLTCPATDAETRKDIKRALDLLQKLLSAAEDSEPISTIFPVNYYLNTSDHLPLALPGRPFPLDFIPYFNELLRNKPEAALEDGEAAQLYHEFLQKSLFEWVASRYFGTWRLERHKFDTGVEFWGAVPGSEKEKSLILSKADLATIFKGNRFASFHEGFGTLALPPGSTLTVKVPQKRSDHGEITISNRFCELTIDTAFGFGGRTLGGYGMLLNIGPATSDFWNHSFHVRVKATFTESLASAPDMVRIKQWANDISNGLQAAFDEQPIWRKTVENLQLLIQAGQLGPGPAKLGSVKFDKPLSNREAAPSK